MFAEFKARRDQQFTCHISYLEIYNEQVSTQLVSCRVRALRERGAMDRQIVNYVHDLGPSGRG